MESKRQKVVVAILYNENRDRILVSRRDDAKHQGGVWEFPGGKADTGETDWQALSRELHEELGITAVSGRYYRTVDYDYGEIKLSIRVWFVDVWTGIAAGKEAQPVNWIDISSLHELRFPPANAKIISMLRLPRLYLITPDLLEYGDEFYKSVTEYLECGVRLLQFRNPSCEISRHEPVLEKLQGLCQQYDCTLMYNGKPEHAARLGIRGIHLNSRRLMSLRRRPLTEAYWISTSCHNIQELKHAENLSLDFCVVSPVKKTASHPDADPMGWDEFKTLTSKTGLPVYALGGMRSDDLRDALTRGAHGLAMISGVWNSANACKEIKKILNYPAS